MNEQNYPKHDINVIFENAEKVLSYGDSAESAKDELKLINTLFAALPVMGVEYGMRFLHGERDLPEEAQELLPLYIRFVNFLEYLETVEKLREIPSNPSTEEIMNRVKLTNLLDETEKAFGKPILGINLNEDKSSVSTEANDATSDSDSESDEGSESSNLHLMIACASVFACKDPIKTSIFYENVCGFKASHLTDEALPHIRLSRDNIDIVLVSSEGNDTLPMRERFNILYDMYIYTNEPKMLELELSSKNVNIVKQLPDTDSGLNQNREFVFEDCDGRYICVSQRVFD